MMFRPTLGACLILAFVSLDSVSATDPPDSDINPVSGFVESVQSVETGGVIDVRHSIDPGSGTPTIVLSLTSNALPDVAPRIAIRDDGVSGVVWWRDSSVDTVLIRTGDATSRSWTAETALSDPSTGARKPSVVTDGSTFWVAFEADAGGGDASIQVRAVLDDPDPIITVRQYVSFTGDIDTRIHFDQGKLWITWVDSGSDVGWSAFDSATDTWSSPYYESYTADSVADARARVRSTVLGD